MRSNVTWDRDPTAEISRVPKQDFKAAHWNWEFFVEREQVFLKDNDPVGLLKDDFTLIPYIAGLNESMEQKYAVFNPETPGNNISFFKK
jgi:hypothetical protein